MSEMSARDLATQVVKGNASILCHSNVWEDQCDAFNNGVAYACEDLVMVTFGLSRSAARAHIRTLIAEEN